jgi:Cof subfamily protein (haloacid dehalogenase superfamily)
VRPRLIGLDLDGTVLQPDGTLGDAMRAALEACRSAGIALAFLTGRRQYTAQLALGDFPGPALVCTNSGCLLWEYPQWTSFGQSRLFPRELLAEVCDALEPHSVNLYHEAPAGEAGRVLLKRRCTPETEHGMLLYGANNRTVTAVDELAAVPNITQLALPCDESLAGELQELVRERFGERLLALSVRWPMIPCHALELFHPEAHKGQALAQFAAHLSIPQAEVMAGGDDTNDLAMLRWAGWGVAMPHAQAEVREASDVVLEGADSQAALAEYLRRVAAAS